jgi:diguanylate cyclase (GGDEF)-like protein
VLATGRKSRLGRLRIAEWPVLQLRSLLLAYILAIVVGWVVAVGVGIWRTPIHLADGLAAALILTCGIVAAEVGRRQGQLAGASKDLLSPWFLPLALLLPPAYALLAPAVLMAHTQYRVTRTPAYRRLFSIAESGLSLAVASYVFHRAVSAFPTAGARAVWVFAALACSVLFTMLSSLLVAVAVSLYSPENTLRSLVLDKDNLLIDAAEVTTGVLVALVCSLNVTFALLAVVPVILLQRGLMHDQLTAAARLDAKTGLLNAPTWETETDSEIVRAKRTGTPLSVMLVDLDHFKQVNDRYGHLVGDDVIRAVAEVMKAQIREYDRCARFGGDEFAILLPQSDLREATRTAQRIQRQVNAIQVAAGEQTVRITVSIGVAQLSNSGQGVTDLLAAADLSLYRAKAAGRHRVVAAELVDLATPERVAPA